jgi:hypothetical protein
LPHAEKQPRSKAADQTRFHTSMLSHHSLFSPPRAWPRHTVKALGQRNPPAARHARVSKTHRTPLRARSALTNARLAGSW